MSKRIDLINVKSVICLSHQREILSSIERTPNTEERVLAGNRMLLHKLH
jgi:hypothetical protein